MSRKLMGRKRGMTRFFDEKGQSQVATLIEVEPNVVTQINLTQSPSKSLRVVRGILPFVIATESHERFRIEDIQSSVGKISRDGRGAFVQITSHNFASDLGYSNN